MCNNRCMDDEMVTLGRPGQETYRVSRLDVMERLHDQLVSEHHNMRLELDALERKVDRYNRALNMLYRDTKLLIGCACIICMMLLFIIIYVLKCMI